LSQNYPCTQERHVTNSCELGGQIFRGLPSGLQEDVTSQGGMAVSAVQEILGDPRRKCCFGSTEILGTRGGNVVSATSKPKDPKGGCIASAILNSRGSKAELLFRQHGNLRTSWPRNCFGNFGACGSGEALSLRRQVPSRGPRRNHCLGSGETMGRQSGRLPWALVRETGLLFRKVVDPAAGEKPRPSTRRAFTGQVGLLR
jgi:hypothetical protein